MNKGQFIIIVILLLSFTNPSPDRHKDFIRNKLNASFSQSKTFEVKPEQNNFEAAGNAIGLLLSATFINKIVDNFISSTNYGLFSTTNVNIQGQSKIIGLGIFGNIFLDSNAESILNNAFLSEKNNN
jgi:hypothetical protein